VRVPEAFWAQVGETFTDIGDRKTLPDLRGDMTRLLADYIHRNGSYRLRDLLEPAARASLASGQDLSWLLALYSPTDADVLWALQTLPDLTPAQRVVLARYRVAVEQESVASSHGLERESSEYQLSQARSLLVSAMLNAGDVAGASAEWNLIPQESRKDYAQTEIDLAARAGSLEQLLARYGAKPDDAPGAEVLRQAAFALRQDRGDSDARPLLEFVYDREIRAGHLEAANFLGLAEVKLEENDSASALALLNRMALVADSAFDTLVPAGDLLVKYSKSSDAADFFQRRVKAVPWDAGAKLRLARLKTGQERQVLLADVVADAQAAYSLRAEAATSNRASVGAPGTELALLAAGAISPDAASKPYYVESRIVAAGAARDPETRFRLWQEALAIAPTDRRVRMGALQAGLALHRDSFVLAQLSRGEPEEVGSGGESPDYDYEPWRRVTMAPAFLSGTTLTDAERASLAVSLGGAAERLDELDVSQRYLRTALSLIASDARGAIETRLRALQAEQSRRAKNAARLPLVKDVIDQDRVVRAMIPGGTR
jgi:thioredoxin-like negative regulator of GroEL